MRKIPKERRPSSPYRQMRPHLSQPPSSTSLMLSSMGTRYTFATMVPNTH